MTFFVSPSLHQDLQFNLENLEEGILLKVKDNLGKIDTVKDSLNYFSCIVKECSTYMLVANYVDRYGKIKELKITVS